MACAGSAALHVVCHERRDGRDARRARGGCDSAKGHIGRYTFAVRASSEVWAFQVPPVLEPQRSPAQPWFSLPRHRSEVEVRRVVRGAADGAGRVPAPHAGPCFIGPADPATRMRELLRVRWSMLRRVASCSRVGASR